MYGTKETIEITAPDIGKRRFGLSVEKKIEETMTSYANQKLYFTTES